MIAACDGSGSGSREPADEIPLIDGPFQTESSWWIPVNAWSYDLPCASLDDPPADVDIDGDGDPDGFALGPPITDDRGDTVQAVCIGAEAHLILNGNSVGKCPWPGGRNRVFTFYADADCNGEIDDANGNGRLDDLGYTAVLSFDGPLPPIPGMNEGEVIVIGDQVIPITADNYAVLVDSLGIPIDTDQDGQVDVTAYYYDGDLVTKRHYEIDPRTGNVTEIVDDREVFPPTNPGNVPDDLDTGFRGGDNISMEGNMLPAGVVVHTTEHLEVSGTSHAIAAELEGALPVKTQALDDGFLFRFVTLRSSGSVAVRVDADTRAEQGWDVLPLVFLDGEPLTGTSREDAGALVIEAELLAEHAMTLEVRFPTTR